MRAMCSREMFALIVDCRSQQVASEDELSAMLVVLERREIESETELSMLQEDILLGEW